MDGGNFHQFKETKIKYKLSVTENTHMLSQNHDLQRNLNYDRNLDFKSHHCGFYLTSSNLYLLIMT